MAKKVYLPEEDLSLNFHILKLMTHSIYSIPRDGISPDEVVEKTTQWLGVSPFKKACLNRSLKTLLEGKFIDKDKMDGKVVYTINDKGRDAYDNYVDVMTVWKLEKNYGKPFQLITVSEVFKKSKKHSATHIPETAFYDWPLTFKPTTHAFEDNKEIRTFEVFEKKEAS